MNFKKRISFWFLGSLLLSFNTYATDNLPGSEDHEPTVSAPKIGVPYAGKRFAGPDPITSSSYNFLNPSDRQTTGAAAFVNNVLDNVQLSGTIRLLGIYRNMDKYYNDLSTGPNNFSIYDYPLASVGTNVGGGFPQLELNMTSRISPRFLFNVGYSFANTMTGEGYGSAGRSASSRQNLFFNGKINAGAFRFDISAGGILWMGLSRFTMGQPEYRDSYFNRVPWDWYRNSSLRYEEYYSLSRNVGAEANGRSPLIGFVAKTDILPLGVKVTTLYGRTNGNVPVGLYTKHFPSYTFGTRVEKIIFTRYVAGKIGANYRGRFNDENAGNAIPYNQEMATLDFNLKIRKVRFAGEIGASQLKGRKYGDNPQDVTRPHIQTGFGYSIKAELDRDLTTLPISLEFYHLDKWMVSQDGSIINSNPQASTDVLYDLFYMQNLAQEVGIITNNRQGINLKAEKNVGKLKIQFGGAWSRDIENMGDTVTFQHRVNAFSRSRFHPWFNAGGNYGRLKSGWMRTWEVVTITDAANGISTDYLKGYSALELLLKYKITLFNRDLILLNFNSYNSVDDQLKFIGTTDASFIRVFYEDFTASYKLTKKVSVVGNFGIERAWGGSRTQLAPNGKPLDQTGHAYALGVDYDFAKNAGLHIRHTWMDHKDRNFVNDEFKGTETNIELKIFF